MFMKKFKTESQRVLDLMINSIYTNKEIFLRELLSNCSDAIDKLYYKSLTDDLSGLTRNDFYINIDIDKENGILKITDNGIGMTEKELTDNLGTIAKSGSFDFKKDDKLKDEDINIIGQFGVGFYSAFMVASKIEVVSKAYGEEQAFKWTSKGAEGYEIEPCEKASNGTEISLYIKKDDGGDNYSTFLEEYTIRRLVKKYSDYIRYPIKMEITKYEQGEEAKSYKETEVLNSMVPIWKKKKSEVTKEEYNEFYKSTFFDGNDPVKSISMSVEGAVDFKALLFVPETAPYNYYSKQYEKGLKLYTNGVMIMEKCADLLPDYFSFVKGVVDSEITLNISRETVQQTRQIKAIAQSIEKKIKSELLDLLKNDREVYEKFYKSFGLQLKFGIYQNFGMNKDVLQDLILFYSLKQEKLITLKEYVDNASGDIYYAQGKSISGIKALPQTEKLLSDGNDVLCFIDDVDEFAVKFIGEYEGKKFINATQESVSEENVSEEDRSVLDKVKNALGDKVFKVTGSKNLNNHPVCLSSEGEVSLEMEKVLTQQSNGESDIKAQKVLEINLEHKIFEKLKTASEEEIKELSEILYSLACLIAGVSIENVTEISEKIINLLA
ncbi:MAG: molecular chaperone HtpG [Clostridia bacterium]|nr:molecular chaperone HtpG [Clostridia bacterium]